MNSALPSLTWQQKFALIRHNLHSASRNDDFGFFKSLQSASFMKGVDHGALLAAGLEDDGDVVLHGLDDLNAGMIYIHQDCYKAVYDGIRASVGEAIETRRAKTRVDICQQRQTAEYGITKMVNAAAALIEAQPLHLQETVADVWTVGASVSADAIQFCLQQIGLLESIMDDFILMEFSWQAVQSSTESSVSALRGIFSLLSPMDRHNSYSNVGQLNSTAIATSRRNSVSSTTSSLVKRLSWALSGGQFHTAPAPPRSNRSSLSCATPAGLRSSIIAACPTSIGGQVSSLQSKRMSHDPDEFQRKLSAIPPTPFPAPEINPFDMLFDNPSKFREDLDDSSFSDHGSSPLDADPLATPIAAFGQAASSENIACDMQSRFSHPHVLGPYISSPNAV